MTYDVLKPIFAGKRCAILGFGREGRIWLDILRGLDVCAEIAVADMKPQDIAGVTLLCGEDYLERAADYDLLLQSPGVIIKDKLSEAEKAKILTQTELLLQLKPCKIIGVTGTKGKSTTSSLIYHFLQANGFNAMLIGNIGVPPLERFEEMNENTIAVCEMSCHQLEFVSHSPNISVLLNIFPEHLDHYVSFEAYANAKRNIYRYQGKWDTAIMNIECVPEKPRSGGAGFELITAGFERRADIYADNGSICFFGEEIPPERIKTRLMGKHNVYNICAALAAAVRAGADRDICLNSLPDFNGLEHRLEFVAKKNGVEYINDSICTIPEAAIAAVKAFDGTDCIILGGMDRGIPYDVLGDFLNTGAVKNVVLLPDSGERIGALVTNPEVNLLHAENMAQAVSLASGCAKVRVILCPASASYGFYKNFEERGKHFKELVNAL
ncbi:MAG: UDP-N-acetylmuramoyl-L-alanine--D-glutamate ligase [Oscillospiraceae bacterium]